MQPTQFERRVLVSVTGLSPQVLTETVYALAKQDTAPWIPTEVHLITTAEGARRAQLALLHPDQRWFGRLLEDYALPPIAFSEDQIHVARRADGTPIDDIRTPEDSARMADLIVTKIREFTEDEDCAVHGSIAGGRKTMGYYLGYALTLLGRPQDRLSHVLVNAPFESSWDFFYPTPYSRVFQIRDELVDARDAQVVLAEVPFVPLRHFIRGDLQGALDFASAVELLRAATGPRLRIDLENRRVRAGDRVFSLTPQLLALLALFAQRAKNGVGPVPAPPKSEPSFPTGDPELAEEYLQIYRRVEDSRTDPEQMRKGALRHGMDLDYFSPLRSKLNSALKKALGAGAQPYLVQTQTAAGRRSSYCLDLPPEAIEFGSVE